MDSRSSGRPASERSILGTERAARLAQSLARIAPTPPPSPSPNGSMPSSTADGLTSTPPSTATTAAAPPKPSGWQILAGKYLAQSFVDWIASLNLKRRPSRITKEPEPVIVDELGLGLSEEINRWIPVGGDLHGWQRAAFAAGMLGVTMTTSAKIAPSPSASPAPPAGTPSESSPTLQDESPETPSTPLPSFSAPSDDGVPSSLGMEMTGGIIASQG